MRLKLSTYPDYKDSGLLWVSKIPSHWGTERAKWLFQKMNRPIRSEDEVVTCFRDGRVTLRKNRRVSGFTESLKEIGYQGVRRGDLVIHAMDAFAGAVGVSDSDGKCTPVYSVCQPKRYGISTYYYAHIVREMARSQWLAALAKGIRERSSDFRFDDFAIQFVPVPRIEEQDKIVTFTNHLDRRITRLIRAKRRLIELLTEQKQAIIHSAVTQGLNPNVPLKPTSVDWLGDIPENWELPRFKYLLTGPLQYGANEAADRIDYDEPRYIRITDIDKNGNLYDDTFRSIPADSAKPYLLAEGDILLARSGATVGKSYLYSRSHGMAAFAGYLIRARVDTKVALPSYLYIFFQSKAYWCWVSTMTIQATIQNVSAEKYKNLPIPLPPLSEQVSIIQTLSENTKNIDCSTKRIVKEIALLSEYRTRMIADVVTGKLDVRRVEIPPLDEAALLDEFDSGEEVDLAEDKALEAAIHAAD